MTQEAFAIFAGIHPKSLGQYESGHQTPKHNDLVKIAKRLERATGFPAEWIVMGDGGGGGDTPADRPLTDSNHLPTTYKSHGLRARSFRVVGAEAA
jgi:transcriptional regulator with XRE-family HTH domain